MELILSFRRSLGFLCLAALFAATPSLADQTSPKKIAAFCELMLAGGPVPSENARGPIALNFRRWLNLRTSGSMPYAQAEAASLLDFMNRQLTRQLLLLHSEMITTAKEGKNTKASGELYKLRHEYARKIQNEVNELRASGETPTYEQIQTVASRYLLAVRNEVGDSAQFRLARNRDTPFPFTPVDLRHLDSLTTTIPTEREVSIRDLNDVGPYPVYFVWLSKAIVDPVKDAATFDGSDQVTDSYDVASHDRAHKTDHLLGFIMQAGGGHAPTEQELLGFKLTERKVLLLQENIRRREEFYWAFRAFSAGETDPAVREAMEVEWFDAFHERPSIFSFDAKGLQDYHLNSNGRLRTLDRRLADPNNLGGAVKNKIDLKTLRLASDKLMDFALSYKEAQKFAKMKRGIRRWFWRLFLKVGSDYKVRVIDQIERGAKAELPDELVD